MPIDERYPELDRMERQAGRPWNAMGQARRDADQVCALIREAVEPEAEVASLDTDVVFFGSLARGEWTSGSDVDWTLLVDGPAQAQTS